KQNASPANDDVNLVLFMRRLFIRARWCPEFHVEGAALQNADGALAGGGRDACLSLGKTDHTATNWLAHASHLGRRTIKFSCRAGCKDGTSRNAEMPARSTATVGSAAQAAAGSAA